MSRIKAKSALAALVSSGLMALATCAQADDTFSTKNTAVAPSGFNWMANGTQLSHEEAQEKVRATRVAMIREMGNGSWICSPAGYGRRSQCYRN